MTALLEHFHVAVNTPEDVEKLKKNILQLAMQGKLVEQDSNDEPAHELIQDVLREKNILVKEKTIKKGKPLPEITQEEIPFSIPNSWEWVRLGDLGISNVGLTYKPTDIVESGLPVLRSNNIQDNKICYDDLIKVDVEVKENLFTQKGDLLICARNGSKRLVGKVALIEEDGMSFGAFMAVFRSKFNPYIHKFFTSDVLRNQLTKSGTTTINQITQKMLKEFIIPLPPLSEQFRIVTEIEKLFEKCNQLSNQLVKKQMTSALFNKSVFSKIQNKSNPNHLVDLRFAIENMEFLCNDRESINQLRITILSLAVQGKLLEQDLNNEPASKLIGKIKEEKERLIAGKRIKKEKSLPLITPDEIPYNIPEGWDWVRIGDLFYVGTGSTPSKSNRDYYDGGTVPWITSSATGNEYITNTDSFITELALSESNLKVYEPGTLVIALYGQGKTRGQVSELLIQAATNQACCCLVSVVEETVLKDYTKLFFKKVYNEIRMLATGGAQPNLNVGKIKNTLIPIPPLTEMNKIVNKTNALLAIIEQLQGEIERKNRISEKLTNSVIS